MAYSSRLSSNLVLKGNFDSPLCGKYLAISFFYGLHDVSKVRGVKSHCQGSDSSPYADRNDRNAEFAESSNESSSSLGEEVINVSGEEETPTLDELRELVHKAMEELKVARLNEKAQGISEAAIASRDKATNAWNHVNSKLNVMQGIAFQKATTALSLAEAEARLQVAVDSFELLENGNGSELRQVWGKKELLKEVERLKEVAKKEQMDALEAKEDVANIMLLAEKTVAFKVEATNV
ncbi:hypothetical protein GOBAR_AA05479 [Gossypium barbadense]|uniref:Uncharacterized protein n=1 Tax=Gossypium barbadense TaxID=3634 RepID=A0A2P5YHQ0_GOSBA|nr:hypothetical protein GOBAR_AA05479 [Gossypium barbadense]